VAAQINKCDDRSYSKVSWCGLHLNKYFLETPILHFMVQGSGRMEVPEINYWSISIEMRVHGFNSERGIHKISIRQMDTSSTDSLGLASERTEACPLLI
jgi:hypothetical protein